MIEVERERMGRSIVGVTLLALGLMGCGSEKDPTAVPVTVERSVGCDVTATWQPGDQITVDIEHDGMTRSYLLHVGASIDPAQPVPLWLDFHGLSSNPAQENFYSSTGALADAKGFIVAYPTGLDNAFNAGSCCVATTTKHDDVGFGRAIVADIASKACVNLRRIYSTGMSNGGYMSEYNACKADDLYAAVAPVSAMGFIQAADDCTPTRPVPMIAFNGTLDGLVSYSGSRTSIDNWKERNGCTGEATRTDYGESFCESWTCAEDTELTSCTITGMNHCWPGNTLAIPSICASGGLTDIIATSMIGDFFERFTRSD